MKAHWLALVFVGALLGGCADGGLEEDSDDFGFGDDLQATDDTGVVRGVVVDPAIVPVPNATVVLMGLDRETATSEAGTFGFSDVEPGTYFLEVSKAGFNTTQSSVTVVAGDDEPPVVKVLLARDASDLPYVQPDHFIGFLKCSLSYIALCGVAPGLTGDNFLKRVPLDAAPDWLQMEAVWQPKQVASNGMNLQMSYGGGGPSQTCCTNQGTSPLMVFANGTTVAEHGIGDPHDLVIRMFVWEIPGTGIDDWTGVCVPVVLTTYCQGPGVAIDQDFEVFTHAFYNYGPPEGWRFTEAQVPPPPG